MLQDGGIFASQRTHPTRTQQFSRVGRVLLRSKKSRQLSERSYKWQVTHSVITLELQHGENPTANQ